MTEVVMATNKEPAAALIGLVVGAYAAQAVCVAARLGVADELADGPQPVGAIARRIGAHEPALYRLLRAVADTGVVAELDGRRFALTPLGEVLRSDVPGSLRAWATLVGMPFWHGPWSALHEAVRTGAAAFDRVHGTGLFDYVGQNSEAGEAFGAGMAAMYTHQTILGDYDLRGAGTIVDVGGDRGAVLAAILSANPHLRGVLFDAPDAVAGAEAELAVAGVADRCRVVGGDLLSSVPGGGDVYLLSGMIHNLGDDEAVKALTTCRAAMAEHARLLIAETVLPDGARPSVAKLLDLQMLVLTGDGQFRTESEIRSLLEQAGFRVVQVLPNSPAVTLVEAVPC
jgi:hypothetical protein